MSIRQRLMAKGGASALALALAAAGLLVAAPAKAALLLNVGGNVVTDNGAGDLDPSVGTINNTSTVGGFGVAITIAESTSPGNSTAGLLQISNLSIQNQSSGTGSLTITVSDNNYTAPGAGGVPMTLESDIGGTFSKGAAIGNTVTFQSFADPANGQPTALNPTPLLSFSKATSSTTESFSGSNQGGFTRAAGPYSLTNVTTITLAAGGQVNISGTTTASAVPEPASLGVLALGGLLAARRRRR
jgi:hypothetical protein